MIYKLSNNKVKSINESKSIKEELSYDDIQQMDTKDRHALWMKHHNTDFKNDDEFWDWAESEFPMEFIDESKSIKESSLVDKKVSTLGKRGKPMYFTAAQLKDAKAKYPEYDFEEATIDKSLPQGQKAYIAKKKTNESKSIKEDMNDSDEVLTFKRDVNLANDADEIQLLIYELSDGVAEDTAQQAFNENEFNDLETLKSAVITAIDVYLEDNKWLGESKSIKESYETSSGRKITVYANYNNAEAKAKELGYIEAEYGESFGKEYSYCEWTKTGEPNVGDSIIAYYHFDENGKPKPLSKEDAEWIDQENELGGFEDFNTLKSKSTVESYYSYESARPNTREFLDLMDKYALNTDDILRYLIADYWSDNEVGDFLDAIKVEYDLDESLKNLDEELSDAAKSAEIVLRNKFLNEPYTDSDFRKYAFDYMYNKGISSDEQYKVINHVMSSEDDKMVDLFADLK